MSQSDLAKTIDDAFEKRDGITPKTRGPVRKAVEQALELRWLGTSQWPREPRRWSWRP